MTQEEFIEAFRDGEVGVKIDRSLEFKTLCEFLQEKGFHVSYKKPGHPTIYKYALNCLHQWKSIINRWDRITATGSRGPKAIAASELPWLHGLIPIEKRIKIINLWFDEIEENFAGDDLATLAYLKSAFYGALAAADPIKPPKKQTDGEE